VKIKINETFIFQDKISFFNFSKKIVNVEVDPYESILSLKKKILRRYKLDDHSEIFAIIYRGNELEDYRKISELGLKEGSTVYIICKDLSKLNGILRDKGLL